MAITYLKKSPKTSSTDDTKTREIVENILKDIKSSKEEGCKEYSRKLDKYEGDVVVTKETIEEIKKNLDQKNKR
jgi:sulfopropanediol 3-dehydrogenase